MIRNLLNVLLVCAASSAQSQVIPLPGSAIATLQTATRPDTLLIAIGPWDGTAQPYVTVDGDLTRGAWKIPETDRSSLDLMQSLQDALQAAGLVEIFSCHDSQCGGFDFRFALDLLPPPAMQVNLGDFQYWSGASADQHAAILVTKIADTAYFQIDRIGADVPTLSTPAARPAVSSRTTPDDLVAALEVNGRAVLGDLSFASGSSALDEGRYASLAALAAHLEANPSLRVALVGHTDTSGSLDGNIALSKKRAQSAAARLVQAYGANRDQISAEGMGYLSPLASNLSASGRETNRRVEVIVIEDAR